MPADSFKLEHRGLTIEVHGHALASSPFRIYNASVAGTPLRTFAKRPSEAELKAALDERLEREDSHG